MKPVDKGIRIVHLLIDMSIIMLISSIFIGITGFLLDTRTILLLVFLCYYIFMEALIGQTVGKMITKSVVINSRNSKPSFLKILLRTILRLNPFDSYSYLFGTEIGAHDSLSRTCVIKKSTQQKKKMTYN